MTLGGSSTRTSMADRSKFVQMREKGLSFRNIAKKTGRTSSTVFKWVKHWQRTGCLHNIKNGKAAKEIHMARCSVMLSNIKDYAVFFHDNTQYTYSVTGHQFSVQNTLRERTVSEILWKTYPCKSCFFPYSNLLKYLQFKHLTQGTNSYSLSCNNSFQQVGSFPTL